MNLCTDVVLRIIIGINDPVNTVFQCNIQPIVLKNYSQIECIGFLVEISFLFRYLHSLFYIHSLKYYFFYMWAGICKNHSAYFKRSIQGRCFFINFTDIDILTT